MSSSYNRGSRDIHDFLGNDGAEAGLGGICEDQVYFPMQQVFEEEFQVHLPIKGRRFQFHQYIDIASWLGVLPNVRAKKPNAPHLKPFLQLREVVV
jgi:hypothetical protein